MPKRQYTAARVSALALVAAGALAGLAGEASAAPAPGTVTLSGDTLVFRAGQFAANRVRVSKPGELVVVDVVPLVAGAGCRNVHDYKVACPAAGARAVDIDLGNMADDLAISAPGLRGAVIGSTGDDFFSIEGEYYTGAPTGIVYLGGAGHDKISYTHSAVGVEVSKGAGRGDGRIVSDATHCSSKVQTPVDADDVRDDIEEIRGSAHSDIIVGSNSAYYGDVLSGGAGRDCLWGKGGNDRFIEESQSSGGDEFEGGEGIDTVDYSRRTLPVSTSFSELYEKMTGGYPGEGDEYGAIERFHGGSGDDNLVFSTGAGIELHGGPGNDVLQSLGRYQYWDESYAGTADRFYGGDGEDRIVAGDGDDVLDGGPLTDRLLCGGGRDSALNSVQDHRSECEVVS